MKNKSLVVLILFLLSCCLFSNVYADEEATQSYTVTVVAGDYGTINGDSGKSYNYDQVCYVTSDFAVNVTNDKYDFIGFHISGHPEIVQGNFHVLEDTVLVASYAVKGSSIPYVVYYEDTNGNPMTAYTDANGNPIPEKVELTGPANEDIIVPAIYIEGFWPEGYNYRIPKDNPNKEVHIVYHPNSEIVGPTTTETIYDDTVVYEEGGAGGGAGGAGGGGGTAPVTPVGPQEEIVIPEPEVPQTEPESGNNEPGGNGEEIIEPEPVPTAGFWETLFNNPWLLGGSIGGISLLLIFLFLLFRRKRDNA